MSSEVEITLKLDGVGSDLTIRTGSWCIFEGVGIAASEVSYSTTAVEYNTNM